MLDFDKEELEKLPPTQRLKKIKELKAKIQSEIDKEAEELEEISKGELERQNKELEELIRIRTEEDRQIETAKSIKESTLEKTVEKEKVEEKHSAIEYNKPLETGYSPENKLEYSPKFTEAESIGPKSLNSGNIRTNYNG